ncbi:MAG: GNAT family N-acetyltransferase [Lachnospiraceae bacterium]|nr:GNAT family N-acetyltransferase [Lachnospiraceae bacterium]
MKYKNAAEILPEALLQEVQKYIDGDTIVGFVFYENPVSDVYFSLRPGYEELVPEMIAYAGEHMPRPDGKHQLILCAAQEAFVAEAKAAGYRMVYEEPDMQYDFTKLLDYKLPEGFRFVPVGEADYAKVMKCCYYGFENDKTGGPWEEDIRDYLLAYAPHATMEYAVNIENEDGEYVCHAGMWWMAENKLAYMEPLCTVLEYRGRGLAAAALSELYRRMKPLGATHMTGGASPFYEKIGYELAVVWTHWMKFDK